MSNGPIAANRPAVIERSLLLMEREETRAVRRVAAAYRQARLEIVDYLLTHIPSGLEQLTPGQRVEIARRRNRFRAAAVLHVVRSRRAERIGVRGGGNAAGRVEEACPFRLRVVDEDRPISADA